MRFQSFRSYLRISFPYLGESSKILCSGISALRHTSYVTTSCVKTWSRSETKRLLAPRLSRLERNPSQLLLKALELDTALHSLPAVFFTWHFTLNRKLLGQGAETVALALSGRTDRQAWFSGQLNSRAFRWLRIFISCSVQLSYR